MSRPREGEVALVRRACLALPEAYEEEAWVGTRWRVGKRTFAHVLMLEAGWPPAYARAAGSDGPLCLLTFWSSGGELEALRHSGPPFFKPHWAHGVVGMVLDASTDWEEVAELLTESYCLRATRALRQRARCSPPRRCCTHPGPAPR